jgi:soluble lytic murein transglycosylase
MRNPIRRLSIFLLPILLALLFTPRSAVADASGDTRLPAVREALQAAEGGRLDPAVFRSLANHPLASWIEYAQLKHDLASDGFAQTGAARIRSYLTRYAGQPPANLLREAWLRELDRRQDWSDYRAFYAGSENPALRCADLAARLAIGQVDAAWDADAVALWRTGVALPADCDAPFLALADHGKLTPGLRWQRIELAADAGNSALMRSIAAAGLAPEEKALAIDYAAFIERPGDAALAWPKTDRSRRIAVDGLIRLAKSDPDATERQFERLGPALRFDEHDRGRVLYQIALWTVASYLPGAAQRLAAVPAASYDERLHEWQVREAMARGDDAAALKAIDAMDASQRNDPRWQYFAARLHERRGDRDGAKALYAQAARTATFHGFLAADRIGAPYALCPLELQPARADRARVAASPALVRALDLFRIDRIAWAEYEWKQALGGFNDADRLTAVLLAQRAGWHDRAVFALGKTIDGKPAPDELRLYALRFPLDHERAVKDAARRNALDPAWLAAEIRAESVWMPFARSTADARGLLQLLPSTGARMARALGLPWNGGETLFDPQANIAFGAAYLRQLLDRFGSRTYLAIGAYNAGSAPVQRWLAQRPQLDPDFWIETIAYKETREYIARVLAFSVIYDWRFDGLATPLSERMLGRPATAAQRHRFACPTDTNSAGPAANGATP